MADDHNSLRIPLTAFVRKSAELAERNLKGSLGTRSPLVVQIDHAQ